MSTATLEPLSYRADEAEEPVVFGMAASTWVKLGTITLLFSLVFWPNLRRLWLKTNPISGEANWGHAICVPIIGLYYLFVHREALYAGRGRQFVAGPIRRPGRLFAGLGLLLGGVGGYFAGPALGGLLADLQPVGEAAALLGVLVLLADWGIGTVLFGLAVFVFGIYPGQNDYVKDLGMVITLFGVVLTMFGTAVTRVAWFPIAFLVCALPWPGLFYSWIASPLQALAANTAVAVLRVTNVEAICSGTKIVMYNHGVANPPRVLNVAEACAGMRSLMTFISVGTAIAFLSSRPLWQKLIVILSAVPIAIFCNVMRISGQGLLDHWAGPQWSENFAHQFVGMMMLIPAFFLILAVGYLLDKLFVEVADDDVAVKPVAAPTIINIPRAAAKPAAVAIQPSVQAPVAAPKPTVVAAQIPKPAAVAAVPKPTVTPPANRPVTGVSPAPRPTTLTPPPTATSLPRPPGIPRVGPTANRVIPPAVVRPKPPAPVRPPTPEERP